MRRHWLSTVGAGVAMVMLAVALMNTRLDALSSPPHQSPYLLAWRLLLYGAIALLWWRLDRLRTDPAARQQWRRLAAICALLILAIELGRGLRA
jgi:glucan phosphoethanolaminetransferase (alkaline phosphatase superfamily)